MLESQARQPNDAQEKGKRKQLSTQISHTSLTIIEIDHYHVVQLHRHSRVIPRMDLLEIKNLFSQ